MKHSAIVAALLCTTLLTTSAFAAPRSPASGDWLDPPGPGDGVEPLRREIERIRGEDAAQSPFDRLGRAMGRVVEDLSISQTDEPVQEKQAAILSELDVLIAQVQKQCDGGGNGSGTGRASSNPTSPAQQSTLKQGPGGQGPLRNSQKGASDWAALPDHEREKILQAKTEGFSAGYEDILGDYYRQLAERESETSPISDEE